MPFLYTVNEAIIRIEDLVLRQNVLQNHVQNPVRQNGVAQNNAHRNLAALNRSARLSLANQNAQSNLALLLCVAPFLAAHAGQNRC